MGEDVDSSEENQESESKDKEGSSVESPKECENQEDYPMGIEEEKEKPDSSISEEQKDDEAPVANEKLASENSGEPENEDQAEQQL